MGDLILNTIQHNSPAYWETVRLRERILRVPLGLTFSRDELQQEKEDLHLTCHRLDELVACVILHPKNDHQVKLRQMAVKETWQHHGIGKNLVRFAEKIAEEKGYQRIELHARKSAETFYEKIGYQRIGPQFLEVGIPHFLMEKQLTPKNINTPFNLPKLEL